MDGFFSATAYQSSQPPSLLPRCGACGAAKGCKTPKMDAIGKGSRKILIVANQPTEMDDQEGKAFIDASADWLKKELSKVGISMFDDCWLTYSLICHTPDPTPAMVDYCRPLLNEKIEEYQPNAILTLGGRATGAVLAPYWKENINSATKWDGFVIPLQPLNTWVLPSFDAHHIRKHKNPVARIYFHQLLKKLSKIKKKPYKKVPKYEDEVEVILDVKKAAKIIKQMRKKGGVIAPDFECNCLKCEQEHARILTCAICWNGVRTIAYPMAGPAIQETAKILHDHRTKKIASNLKFEDRWSRKHLGGPVNGWLHDTMVTAHQLDNNRMGSKGLKFQSFVKLGFPAYDSKVDEYMEATVDGKYNTLELVELDDLLLYNGLDSLLEYKLAMIQRSELDLPC